jgi:hypothetical protein
MQSRDAVTAASLASRAGAQLESMLAASGARSSAVRAITATGIAIAIGAAAAIQPRLAIILCAALLVPLLVWTDPRIGFAWVAFSLGINVDVLDSPVHVSLPQLVALAVLAGVIVRWNSPAQSRRGPGLWGAAGLVFAIAAMPSLLRSVRLTTALVGILELFILGAVLAIAVRWMMRRPDTVNPVLSLLVAGAALTLVPALVQVTFGIGPAPFRAGGVMRAYATFSEPNTYGLYLAGVVPVALALTAHRRSLACAASAASIVLALGLTGSRGAWVGAIAGLAALGLVAFQWKLRAIVAVAACAVGIATLAWLLPRELIVARFDFGDWSVQQRLLVLLSALDGIAHSPVLGHGAGSFAAMLSSLGRLGLVDDVTMTHNLLLDVWFQFGLLPLVILVLFAIAYAIATGRAVRRARDLRLAGLFGGVTAMFAASMFGTFFVRGAQETLVLLIALSAALVSVAGAENATETTHA